MARIAFGYLHSALFPRKSERSLEDFFINRFGKELYETFFKDYTEKVWGMPCDEIRAEWGAQRVKGLSGFGALARAVKNLVSRDSSIDQKDVETSLINQFLYPKLGPGQMWEEVATRIREHGGEVHLSHRVVGLRNEGNRVTHITVRTEST
jgi:protoporphyrinogen oxidase